MNEAVGIVRENRGTTVVVEVDSAACPRCQAGQGCGAGIFTASRRRVSMTVPVRDGLQLLPGDSVRLCLPPGRLLRGVFLVYGLPLSALLLASGIAYLAGLSEPATLVWTVAGLGAGFAAGGSLSRRDACLSNLRPMVRTDDVKPLS